MKQQSLFDGNIEPVTPGSAITSTKKIVIQSIEPRLKREVLCENAPEWVSTRYTDPLQIYEMFQDLRNETKEHFVTLHLDGKNRIACKETVSIGTLNQSLVHPREVFKTALLSNAAAIILIHNHPTGDSTPSKEDIAITKRLKEAGDIIGVRVLDHIIVGDSYRSFVEDGLI